MLEDGSVNLYYTENDLSNITPILPDFSGDDSVSGLLTGMEIWAVWCHPSIQ